MANLSNRIAELSPEKRELLHRLLSKEQGAEATLAQAQPDSPAISPAISQDMIEAIRSNEYASYTFASSAEKKTLTRQLYNLVSSQLNASPFVEHAFFLNLGYCPDHNPSFAQVNLSEYALNKNCRRLVLEVIGDCDIKATDTTLDVGCGRGGTISVLHQYFRPQRMVGIDLSSTAVAFCNRYHANPNTFFLEGDAEHLPFANDAFDIVTNLESSHNYPTIDMFYQEVHRVLRQGGFFLYTDLFPCDNLSVYLDTLQTLGFVIEHDRDITSNVLRSCDEIGQTHFNAFDQHNDSDFMGNFLGVPGSTLYENMKAGKTTYRIYKLRKLS
ncbi:MAG: class I SAM-dependent methyltransferase [Candidatus Tectomicrobia bacterium]